MRREIKRMFSLHWSDLISAFVSAIGIGLLSSLIALVANRLGSGSTSRLGGFGLLAGLLVALIYGHTYLSQEFNIALSMGALRRHYLVATAVFVFSGAVGVLILGNVWAMVENRLYGFPATLLHNGFLVPLPYILPVALGVAVAGCFLGVVAMRSHRWGNVAMIIASFGPLLLWTVVESGLSPDRTDLLGRLVKGIASFLVNIPAGG